MRADCNAAQLQPGSWPGLTREALARRRLLPLLGPPGHGGVGALQAPAGDRAPTERRNDSAQARVPCKRCHPPALHS
jgi:hypothetical protein